MRPDRISSARARGKPARWRALLRPVGTWVSRDDLLGLRWLCSAGLGLEKLSCAQAREQHANRSCDARRHQVDEADEKYAEDRPRRGFRDLVGDVRHELD